MEYNFSDFPQEDHLTHIYRLVLKKYLTFFLKKYFLKIQYLKFFLLFEFVNNFIFMFKERIRNKQGGCGSSFS